MPTRAEQIRFDRAYKLLKTIAVTGTNGKTTTVSMLASIVRASGEAEARLTTLGSVVAGESFDAGPPDAEFLTTVERACAEGVKTFALEVTSKALRTGWAQKWPAHIAVFTNLSRDHLDMHGTGEAYFAAKAQLFLSLAPGGQCVLNASDANALLLAEAISPDTPVHWYGKSPDGDRVGEKVLALAARRVQSTREGLEIDLADSDLATALGGTLKLPIVGDVHADNALAAALGAYLGGYSPAAIQAGLTSFSGVPGRFQIVSRAPLTVVDYAHTPGGLRGTLETARGLLDPGGLLRLVFGCGGDRDQGKRAEMGQIADELADWVMITNDNPRFEDPEQIAAQIQSGAGGRATWELCLERSAAVRRAILAAEEADIVVVAGKGHERIQEVAGASLPMCDQQLVCDALDQR